MSDSKQRAMSVDVNGRAVTGKGDKGITVELTVKLEAIEGEGFTNDEMAAVLLHVGMECCQKAEKLQEGAQKLRERKGGKECLQ